MVNRQTEFGLFRRHVGEPCHGTERLHDQESQHRAIAGVRLEIWSPTGVQPL
jgi:hypothetical protein